MKSPIKIWSSSVSTGLISLLFLLQKTLVVGNMHCFQNANNSCLGWEKRRSGKKFLGTLYLCFCYENYSHIREWGWHGYTGIMKRDKHGFIFEFMTKHLDRSGKAQLPTKPDGAAYHREKLTGAFL